MTDYSKSVIYTIKTNDECYTAHVGVGFDHSFTA